MSIVVKEFDKTKKIFDNLKSTFPNLKTLSMGMSSDYKIAINHGSNMIRVGSLILVKEFKIKYSMIDIETTGGKFNPWKDHRNSDSKD